MNRFLLENAAVILPGEKIKDLSVLIENGQITGLGIDGSENRDLKIIDLNGLTLYPGFIDVHIHGAVGVDTMEANADDLRKMAAFLAEKGTTAWLPTFVPDSDENYRRSIKAIENFMETQEQIPVSQALGVHYEGVFANEKMCGALRPKFFKTFEKGNEIDLLPKLKNGKHFTTLAPEVENGIELIKKLTEQNWIVSIGHTKADIKTLDEAKKAGAKHMTHFFNAMTGLHHREIGVVGWGLGEDDVTFDIIADGVHVDPRVLQTACKAKNPKRVSLISDAVLPTGLGDGEFEIWGEKVSVVNGKTRNERGSIAGSVITMLDAVKMMLALGFSEAVVSQMASAHPARLLGIEKTHGSIEIEKRADLVALDDEGNVKLVLIAGDVAFSNI